LSKQYNLHDKISVKVECDDLIDDYDYYFRNYSSPNDCNLKYKYTVRSFNELKSYYGDGYNEVIREGNCVIFPNRNYGLEINGNEITEYTFEANYSTTNILQFLLLKQDMTLVHSMGFTYKGKTVLMPSLPGIGKTSLLSQLSKDSNFFLYGDDYTIIDNQSNIYSLLGDISLHEYHLDFFDHINDYMSYRDFFEEYRKYKEMMSLKGFYGKLSRRFGRSKIREGKDAFQRSYLKIPIDEILPKSRMLENGEIDLVIHLEKYNGKALCFKRIDYNDSINRIISTLELEFRSSSFFFNYLAALGMINIYKNQYKLHDILYSSMSQIEHYALCIPYEYDVLNHVNELETYLTNKLESLISNIQ
jgi:hypothetical protein